MTLPLLPNTFPNLTATKFVLLLLFMLCTTISAIRLLTPMTFVGLTALSGETKTNVATLFSFAASATFFVPIILFLIDSFGLVFINDVFLCAAARSEERRVGKECRCQRW